jgi:GTPase
MKTKNDHIMTLLIGFAVLIIITGCHKTPEQRAEHVVSRISDKLDLNETQKTKLNAIKDEFMAKAPAMRAAREETFRNVSMTLRHPATEFSVLFPHSKEPVSVY